MKKILILAVLLITMTGIDFTAKAQSFKEGDWVINAGIGLGHTFSYVGSGAGIPIGAGAEYGISDLTKGAIGIGGDFGFVSVSGLNVFYFGAKGSYHFNELFELENDKLDIYGGLGLYFRQFNWSGFEYSYNSGIYPAFHLGTRYYFTEKTGIYGELGNSWGWLNVGVVFKL